MVGACTFVLAAAGAWWNMASQNIVTSIERLEAESGAFKSDVLGITETRHSAVDDAIIMNAERTIRDVKDAHIREVIDIKIEHLEAVLTTHVGAHNYHEGVLLEMENLRAEMYQQLSSEQHEHPH